MVSQRLPQMSEKYVVPIDQITKDEIQSPTLLPEFRALKLVLPKNSNLRSSIAELIEFLNTQSYLDIGFNIQILPNSSTLVELEYRLDPLDLQGRDDTLSNLDCLTSQIITNGGTISAKDRRQLDEISPHLFERIAGRAGYKL